MQKLEIEHISNTSAQLSAMSMDRDYCQSAAKSPLVWLNSYACFCPRYCRFFLFRFAKVLVLILLFYIFDLRQVLFFSLLSVSGFCNFFLTQQYLSHFSHFTFIEPNLILLFYVRGWSFLLIFQCKSVISHHIVYVII